MHCCTRVQTLPQALPLRPPCRLRCPCRKTCSLPRRRVRLWLPNSSAAIRLRLGSPPLQHCMLCVAAVVVLPPPPPPPLAVQKLVPVQQEQVRVFVPILGTDHLAQLLMRVRHQVCSGRGPLHLHHVAPAAGVDDVFPSPFPSLQKKIVPDEDYLTPVGTPAAASSAVAAAAGGTAAAAAGGLSFRKTMCAHGRMRHAAYVHVSAKPIYVCRQVSLRICGNGGAAAAAAGTHCSLPVLLLKSCHCNVRFPEMHLVSPGPCFITGDKESSSSKGAALQDDGGSSRPELVGGRSDNTSTVCQQRP